MAKLPKDLQAALDAARALYETLREIYEIGSTSTSTVDRYKAEAGGMAWVMAKRGLPPAAIPPASWRGACKQFAENYHRWTKTLAAVLPQLPRDLAARRLMRCVGRTNCGTLLLEAREFASVAGRWAKRERTFVTERDGNVVADRWAKRDDIVFRRLTNFSIGSVEVGDNWEAFLAEEISRIPYREARWRQLWFGIEREFERARPESVRKPRVKRTAVAEDKGVKEAIIAALTKHHRYDNGSCGNQTPVGVTELARMLRPDSPKSMKTNVSRFFKKKFGGYRKYCAMCRRDKTELAAALKLLNGEYAPKNLYERNPPGERDGRSDD